MLAPIFKRINREGQRESEFRELWLPRSERILETLVATGSSIVCLQECWLSHPEWVRLFDSALGAAGYRTLKLPRTNNRGDGLMIAVKNEQWRVVDYQQLLFHDCGDRVAQIVRLRSKGRLGGKKEGEEGGQEEQQEEEEDLLVVNTHLLFPHDANSNIIRLCQVYKLLERVEQCRSEQSGRPAPVILCGDLNGTKEGNVYKLLRSQGFLSSYDTAHHLNDVDEKWVSHRSHRGDVCGVDYVWMLNASTPMSNPVLNWRKAVFGLIKSKLLAAGITDARHAFQFFATAGDTSPTSTPCASPTQTPPALLTSAWITGGSRVIPMRSRRVRVRVRVVRRRTRRRGASTTVTRRAGRGRSAASLRSPLRTSSWLWRSWG
ncbi:hypothetical protein CLOM_g23714 [Closterium sp. NIES-68]|nr:hypothetical protein CLOM_g23714 [Closterium sp. NIES-68]